MIFPVDKGPSHFTDTATSPCGFCGVQTNWLMQVVKYQCNNCRYPVHFYHVPSATEPGQTERVQAVQPKGYK